MSEWPDLASAVEPAEREWLRAQAAEWADLEHVAVIVHIGVAEGMSLACSRLGAPEAFLVGVDLDTSHCDESIGVDQLIQGNSHLVHQQWAEPIHFLFVDGDHSKPAVLADMLSWLRHVAPGGVVAFHDYGNKGYAWCRGVSEAVDIWDWTGWQEIPAAGSIKAYRREANENGKSSD